MAPGPSCWPARTPMPTRPGSWTGWSRSTPRWSGCTSTGRARGGSAATRPRSHPMTGRTAQRAASARGASPNDKNSHPEPLIGEPGDHAIGRSRGGLTTKVHALTDGAGRVLVILLTGGNVRGFCQLKQWRGLATRYDKHARNYAGALSLAALLTWLP